MDLKIQGKVALITGGANGIGARIGEQLAAEGVSIVVADIVKASADAQATRIREAGGKAIAVQVDVTDQAGVAAMAAEATSAFGGVDILVNNAGFTRDMRITKMEENDWDAVVDVILKGAFLCTRAVTPAMIEKSWGRVINISSRAHLGNKGQANYSAGKAGLIGFTRAMALELGAFNITVNAIAPGMIGTEALRALPHFPSIIAAAEKNTPVRRIGEPEDVADAVAFLASNLAGFISGEVLHVTGGRY